MEYQRRRQLQADQTRRAILASAAQLSRQGSFENMTVRDICAAAGVTTGAFYHHFSSKEDLLTQGFSSLDAFLSESLAPYQDKPPLERLDALLRNYARYMQELGWETAALYYGRRLAHPAASASLSPQRYTLRTMLECLTDLAREGILSPEHTPEWTAEFFFRHFRGTVIDWILHQGDYPLWDKLSQDYDLFAVFFRA